MNNSHHNKGIQRKLMDRFREKNIHETSIKDYMDSFSRMINHFKFVFFKLPYGLKLHRVRVHESPEDIKNLSDIWCPEPAKSIGRLNDLNDTILYTSHGADTSIRELNPVDGMYCTCLELEILHPVNFVHIGILEFISNENAFFNGIKHMDYNNKAIKIAYNNNKKLIEIDRELKRFITEEFVKDVDPGNIDEYKISIAIAKQFFLSKDIGAIAYPSIKSDKLNINVAIKSDIAKTHLIATRIDMFQIKDSVFQGQPRQALYPIKGCYQGINFIRPLEFSDSRDVEGWATKDI